jgi:hypothetical protein
VTLACALAGCATGRRADLGRPIDIEPRWYGHSYEQDGERIGRCRLALALYETPEGRAPIWSAGTYAINGLLFVGGSIGAGMAASVTSSQTSVALVGVSAASALFAAFLLHRADGRIADAVCRHNAIVERASD